MRHASKLVCVLLAVLQVFAPCPGAPDPACKMEISCPPRNDWVGGLTDGASTAPPLADFNFIACMEGLYNCGYVPQNKACVTIGNSGVTIGKGIDLGSKDRKYFEKLGVDSSVIDRLAPYFGKTKGAAILALKAKPLKLTDEEARALSMVVANSIAQGIERKYDNQLANPRNPAFHQLNRAKRTAVISVLFQYGSATKVPKFWGYVTRAEWEKVVAELQNFGDDYGSRRTNEAHLILAAATSTPEEKTWLTETYVQEISSSMTFTFDPLDPWKLVEKGKKYIESAFSSGMNKLASLKARAVAQFSASTSTSTSTGTAARSAKTGTKGVGRGALAGLAGGESNSGCPLKDKITQKECLRSGGLYVKGCCYAQKCIGRKGACLPKSVCTDLQRKTESGQCPGTGADIVCCLGQGTGCLDYTDTEVETIEGNNGVEYKVVRINDLQGPSINRQGDDSMTVETAAAFTKMYCEADVRLSISSGFRTIARQQHFWDMYGCDSEKYYVRDKRYCKVAAATDDGASKGHKGSTSYNGKPGCSCGPYAAVPGSSNHGKGQALDLAAKVQSSPAYQFLKAKGKSYGFCRTVKSENWHWEHGADEAKCLTP